MSIMLNWTNDVPPGSLSIFQTVLKNKNIKTILEIGCYQGISVIGFLNLFPKAHVVGIDLWDHFNDSPTVDMINIEKEFDKNIVPYKHRVKKIKEDSRKVLIDMFKEGRKFDLIYVDGSHSAFDVYSDAVFSWLLLNDNGILIFDDYIWNRDKIDSSEIINIPYPGIQHFLRRYKGEYRILYMGYRVFIQKLPT